MDNWISIHNSNGYIGYLGTYNGEHDIDIGTGFANDLGKLHMVTKAIPRMTVDENGNVGIGITTPSNKLDIAGDIHHDFPGTTGNALYATGSSSDAMYLIENNYEGDGLGLSAGMSSSSAGNSSYGVYGYNYGTGYGVCGISNNILGTGVYGKNDIAGNYGFIGGRDYAVFGNLDSANPGDYAIYGKGVNATGEDGLGYVLYLTFGRVLGYNSHGNPYTFGVADYSYLQYPRSGGTFGGRAFTTSTHWGCLAYKSSGGLTYGGYFTSHTSGTGKDTKAQINNGIGAWGDLFGADIHGKVYGAFIEGENYATYSKGTSFHDGLDVHLQKTGNHNTVLYTNVSTDATVQTMGYVTINNGKASIVFDEAFTQIVTDESPIIVTATPTGESKGIYITKVNENGFMVTENDNGKSNITVSYIAIGKRKGYESPVLAEEVIAADYTSKLARGLHNDGDTQTDGEGLYYENGKLTVGIHPSTLPDKNRPVPTVGETPVKPEIRDADNNNSNGKAK